MTDWIGDGTATGAATATFNPALAADLDRIRLALGDTDVTNALLADATITAMLALYTYSEALSQLAQGLITKVAQEPDSYSESGGLTLKWGARITAWQELVTTLKTGVTSSAVLQSTIQAAVRPSTTSTVLENANSAMTGLRTD